MKTVRLLIVALWARGLASRAGAQDAEAAAPAAAAATTPVVPLEAVAGAEATEFMEHLVDKLIVRLEGSTDANTMTRYLICAGIWLVTFLFRRVVVNLVFALLGSLARNTKTTLDDELFRALRNPVATLVVVIGGVMAMKALKMSETADRTLAYVYTVAFSIVVFWLFFRAFNTVLDHLHTVTKEKQMAVSAFMPWIKKSLVVLFVIFGALMTAQSLGADVKAFLAGLGIGGLAFALAAQDTIANVFGSVVVAIDQPFKVGETVQIGAHVGTVEDIGLRSTKIRTAARSLLTIPNKTVAAEAITNLSRFSARRVEQTLGLTYGTTPTQMEEVVDSIRALLVSDDGVDKTSVVCHFVQFGPSSLDIQVIYVTLTPDFVEHLKVRQRLNVAIMRIIESRRLSFAYPTQTLHVESLPTTRVAQAK